MIRFSCTFSTVAILLAACVPNTVDAPSLLPRASEKLSFDEPAATPVAVAPDPALDDTIADASQKLATNATEFAIAATKTENLIGAAKGAAPGSAPWLDAQVALAALDDLRATSLAILSDLDDRAIAHGATGAPAYAALDSLRAEAQAQATTETEQIRRLSARLPSN
ncbi:MAG TPA: hypothetical protein VM657_02480 [Sphingomonas sp.]|nr:hypothetical protein [Sphingomonas sp.]